MADSRAEGVLRHLHRWLGATGSALRQRRSTMDDCWSASSSFVDR
ncbi:MAG: hypothetical protein ACYC3I_17320 [Gemmataceae bacterium]